MHSTRTRIASHLPKRLAICYYGWDWLTSALPDEAYGDLDRAMRETKERGFNCIRPDMGLGLLYDRSGQRLGRLEFRARLPGVNSNMQCVDAKGGGIHDVWQRVMHLFELAEKHDLYIIGTSWLYQDLLTDVADDALRTELVSVPYNDRMMLLAKQWDWLLTDLKCRGLVHRLAMMELGNELECVPCSAAPEHTAPPTWQAWIDESLLKAPPEQSRELARQALALVQEKHPDVLSTVDFASADHLATFFPDNAQVVDHHVYSDGVTNDLLEMMKKSGGANRFSYETGPVLEGNDIRSLLRTDIMDWPEFCRRTEGTRKGWWPTAWFYQNIDNSKYDAWCMAHYDSYRARIKESVEKAFYTAANFAKARGLPLVVDEGFVFYPPLHSRFVTTPEGRWGEEIAVNSAIAHGYWGILPTGYFRPNTPLVWYNDSQCEWIAGLNLRILNSGG